MLRPHVGFARFIAATLLLALSVGMVAAQAPESNPYSDLERSPITGWPPFYKQLKIAPRDQLFYDMGWCRTNHYRYKPSDLIVVDKLPEAVHEATITEVGADALAITTKAPNAASQNSAEMIVRIHPQATQLAVRGPGQPAALRTGLYVRFVGTIDSHGRIAEPVERLDLLSPATKDALPAVTVGGEQSIVGRIGRRDGDRLIVTILTDRRRSVSVPLAADVAVAIDLSDLAWASAGDRCKVRGRLYQSDSPGAKAELLATELEITIARPAAGPTTSRPAQRRPDVAVR